MLHSELVVDNEKYRLDSEFYLKSCVETYRLVKSIKYEMLGDLTNILTDFRSNGSYKSIAQNFTLLDQPDFAYMVRSTDLEKSEFVQDVKYVSESTYNYLSKSKVYGGEILINKIGSPGRAYLMPKLERPVSLGMNLFMLDLKKDGLVRNSFIWLYLNSKVGKQIIDRKVSGSVPLTIDKEAIKTLPIPIASMRFQDILENIINDSELMLDFSKREYAASSGMLLYKLGVENFAPTNSRTSTKAFSESFGATSRLDAEYYQEKYDALFLELHKLKTTQLKDLVTIKKSVEPGSDCYSSEGVPFIRVSDMTKYGIVHTEIHIPPNLTELRPIKDTILLSKDGSVGIAYKVEEDLEAITSGALLHLRIKTNKLDDILPDYLTLVLNSVVVQMQAERDAGGSVIKHWKPEEIQNVVIPLLEIDDQIKIAEQVKKSFVLRRKSESLIGIAKRAVEIAIEEDESTAINWLEERQEALGIASDELASAML